MAYSNFIKATLGFFRTHGFYRRFIKNFASLSFDLTELLKKVSFHWNSAGKKSFDFLKIALTQASVLALPDFTDTSILQADASRTGMDAVLIQKGHLISYFSKNFFPKLLNSSTYVRELHAITTAVQKWHHYLKCTKKFKGINELNYTNTWTTLLSFQTFGLQLRDCL